MCCFNRLCACVVYAGVTGHRRRCGSWDCFWKDRIRLPTGSGQLCQHQPTISILLGVILQKCLCFAVTRHWRVNEKRKAENPNPSCESGHTWKSHGGSRHSCRSCESLLSNYWDWSGVFSWLSHILLNVGRPWDLLCGRWGIQAAVCCGPKGEWITGWGNQSQNII